MNIDNMLADLLKVEGGYVNDPRDSGGETNFGITKATAVANGYTGPMKDMTKAQALAIYQSQYFFKPGFDQVLKAGLGGLAAELFDTGVNMGVKVASTFLQRSLNVLNTTGKDLTVDGSIGAATISALLALVKARGAENAETVLLKAMNCLQGARYIELTEANQKNKAFVYGWLMNRVSLPS